MYAFFKNCTRQVKDSFGRFLSILLISMLGVSAFVGINSASPDMLTTLDAYFAQQRFMDIRLLSTLGFSQADVDAVNTAGYAAFPGYSVEALTPVLDTETPVKIHSLQNEINMPVVTAGRLPQSAYECALEEPLLDTLSLKIGDTLALRSGKDTPITDVLAYDSFTVVGAIRTPLYISTTHGHSTLGSGTLSGGVFVTDAAFAPLEVFTEIYLVFDELHSLGISDEYDSAARAKRTALEPLAERRESERYDEIMAEAGGKLADAQRELDDARAERDEKLAHARAELNDASNQLKDGEEEYASAQLAFERGLRRGRRQLTEAEIEISGGEAELAENRIKLEDGRAELEDGEEQLQQAKDELADAKQKLDSAGVELDDGYDELEKNARELRLSRVKLDEAKSQLQPYFDQLEQLKQALAAETDPAVQAMLQGSIDSINNDPFIVQYRASETLYWNMYRLLSNEYRNYNIARADYESAVEQYEQAAADVAQAEKELADSKRELLDGEKKLLEGEQALIDAKQALEKGRSSLKRSEATGKAKLEEAREELDDARVKLADGEDEYAKSEQESLEKLTDAQLELDDAREELESVDPPSWYILTRSDNAGYSDFADDMERLKALGAVFPVVFFAVAVLVCLTTMTRMVEEQRSQIGTLKVLGYSRFAITMKYMAYAFFPSAVGCALGVVVGNDVFPHIIADAYSILYAIPPLLTPLQVTDALAASAIALVCTTSAAYFACRSELREVPAMLLRPKAPKMGKRILLERIAPIWRRLPFTSKVTARNIFRYKKRFLMTMLGTGGCTALLITGFGLRNSVDFVPEAQFNTIWKYDFVMNYNPDEFDGDRAGIERLLANDQIAYWMQEPLSAGAAADAQRTYDAYLTVIEDPETFSDMVLLRTPEGETLTPGETGAIVTQKLCKLLGKQVGDAITLTRSDDAVVSVPITGITQNYAFHYVYMSSAAYGQYFGEAPECNVLVAKLADVSEAARTGLSTRLSAYDSIISRSFIIDTAQHIKSMFDSLNAVVYVLIILAGLLAIVVLYNLTNINISERIRELATIKVLGFTAPELAGYILRENILLTLLGIAFGLAAGVLLHRFVIVTAEVDLVMFGRTVAAQSFFLSAALTFVFALATSLSMLPRVIKVDMVESLKCVE